MIRSRMILRSLAVALMTVGSPLAAPPANADPMSDLISVMPPGYGPDACHGWGEKSTTLAGLQCGPNDLPGGPVAAVYLIKDSFPSMVNQYQQSYDKFSSQHVPCPGMQSPNPTPINVAGSDTQFGHVSCGDNPPTVLWSINARFFVAHVRGNNLQDLYNWWSTYAFTAGR